MKTQAFISAASAILLAGSNNLAAAQDSNSAFVTKCGPGQWALTFVSCVTDSKNVFSFLFLRSRADDGPSPFTNSLLQLLKTANVPATFFVLGVQLEQAELAKATKAAFDAGHQIASHTYDHSDLNTLTAAQIQDQMTRTETLLKTITGATPNYMRPPFGNCGATCAATMKQLGYVVTQWNVDSNDWRFVGTPDESKAFDAFSTALGAADVKTTGHVSLQHDIHKFSVEMVPKIISAIKAKGLTFVTADKCAGGTVPAYREADAPAPGGGALTPGAPAGGSTTVDAEKATNATNPTNPINGTKAPNTTVPTTTPPSNSRVGTTTNLQFSSGASTIAASTLGFAAASLAAVASI
ncbi:MAG: hypothetical protein BJ554DRAFT_3594 [Olpidium bornovanus]|uniref:NodB homology domain-containing protein n=1 Tax=Olpidium bornovanus TaxID=278681 RepID=A0A8H8DLK3_9FUNG|nr:MAG: hypothetical protein BJ554DRAFT_3594 [Olpidium bornovanus]